MRKFYDDYFRVPKDGIMREKVMLVRITVSIVIMLICLGAMSFSAYAFFSYNISSVNNNIQVANFDVQPTVVNGTGSPVVVSSAEQGAYVVSLQAGQDYTITLRQQGAALGFCVITAEGLDAVYHTQQLGAGEGVGMHEICFTVRVAKATRLSILPHWGTSSHYDAYAHKGQNEELYILDGELVRIGEPATASTEESTTVTTTTTVATAESTTTTTVPVTTTTMVETTTTTESAVVIEATSEEL